MKNLKLQENPQNTLRSQLNTSSSKMQYTISRSNRFSYKNIEYAIKLSVEPPMISSMKYPIPKLRGLLLQDMETKLIFQRKTCKLLLPLNIMYPLISRMKKRKGSQCQQADKSSRVIQYLKPVKMVLLVQANTSPKILFQMIEMRKEDIL